MPVVHVFYRPPLSDARLDGVLAILPKVVVEALVCGKPGSPTCITEKEVKIRVFKGDKRDQNTELLEICIHAYPHAERRANLDERIGHIKDEVNGVILRIHDKIRVTGEVEIKFTDGTYVSLTETKF